MTDELKQWEYDKGYDKGQADILNKIRAEIEKESEVQTLQLHWGEANGLNMAIDIINKYKTESEG